MIGASEYHNGPLQRVCICCLTSIFENKWTYSSGDRSRMETKVSCGYKM